MLTRPSTKLELTTPIDGVWNAEDLVMLPETPWVLASGMKSPTQHGCLFVIDSRRPAKAVPLRWKVLKPVIAPHGLSVRRRPDGLFDALAVDHQETEAVLTITLTITEQGPEVLGFKRILMPPNTFGNAIDFWGEGGFLVSSMFDPQDGATLKKFAHSEPTGHVWRYAPSGEFTQFCAEPFSGSNGMVVDAASSEVFVSEWAARRVWRLDRAGNRLNYVEFDFLPDNLRWAGESGILVAGQVALAEDVHNCQGRGTTCPRPYAVTHLSTQTLEAFSLYKGGTQPSEEFAGATVALAVGEEIWLGSFMGTTIARLRPVA